MSSHDEFVQAILFYAALIVAINSAICVYLMISARLKRKHYELAIDKIDAKHTALVFAIFNLVIAAAMIIELALDSKEELLAVVASFILVKLSLGILIKDVFRHPHSIVWLPIRFLFGDPDDLFD